MSRLITTAMFVISAITLSLLVFPAAAQLNTISNCKSSFGIAECADNDNASTLRDKIVVIGNAFLTILGIVAVIAIIWGGVQYIMSAGEPDKARTAKHTIIYAIVGIVVVILSAVIVRFIVESGVGG